jgi:GNAT superfamily N-acetyltransferase
MSITIERAVEASPEVYDLIGELNDVLGAAYESHQRHGLSIVQLFEPNVRFFLARLDGLAVGCGGVAVFDDYAEVKRMYTRPATRGRGVAKALLAESRTRFVGQTSRSCASKRAPISRRRSVSTNVWAFGHEVRSARMRQCQPATSRRASFSRRSFGSQPQAFDTRKSSS